MRAHAITTLRLSVMQIIEIHLKIKSNKIINYSRFPLKIYINILQKTIYWKTSNQPIPNSYSIDFATNFPPSLSYFTCLTGN